MTRTKLLPLLALLALPALSLPAADPGIPADVARSENAVKPLDLGERVPDGPVRTLDGTTTSFRSALGSKPSVVIFYRGGWCPYCNIQMEALMGLEPKLQALGYQIVALSPDKPEKMRLSLEKHKLTYTLLSDSRLDLARSFGLAYKIGSLQSLALTLHGIDLEGYSGESHHWLPVPAAYVIDATGTIRFKYVNPDYTVRVDPQALYAAAQAALPAPDGKSR